MIQMIVTGITYLDGRPFIGTGLTDSGKQVKLVYGESSQNLRILDRVTASGVDHYSPHHHDRAFAVERVEAVERIGLNTLRRHLHLPSGTAAHAPESRGVRASGTHTITATYNGSASFDGSSASLTQTVD